MKTFYILSLLSATLSTVFAADINSPVILNRGDYDQVYRDDIVPAPVTRLNAWLSTIPKVCADLFAIPESNGPRCALANLRVVEAWFSDAPDSWVVCHCAVAEYSLERYLTEIGRLPPGIRKFIRYFLGFPGYPNNGVGGTVTSAGDVVIHGLDSTLLLVSLRCYL